MKEMNENSGQAFDDFVRKSIDGSVIDFNPSAWEELSAQLDMFDRAIINEKRSFIDKLKSWMSLSLNSFFAVLLGLGGLFVIVVSADGVTPKEEMNGLSEQFIEEVKNNNAENEKNPVKNDLVPIESTDEKEVGSREMGKERKKKKKSIPNSEDVISSDSIPEKDSIKEKDVFIFW